MSFTATCQTVRNLSARWPQALLRLIEDKANGPAVISALNRMVPGIVPEGSRRARSTRASAITPLVQCGNVYLPGVELAPWVQDLVEDAAAFPGGAHDDQVDALSQALNRLVLQPLLVGEDLTESEDLLEDDEQEYLMAFD